MTLLFEGLLQFGNLIVEKLAHFELVQQLL